MKGSKNIKAKKQLQAGRDVPGNALEIVIRNVVLDCETIKSLRLTSKGTKAAADARVRSFTLTGSLDQEPQAVKRSGLLNNIETLNITYDLTPSSDVSQHSKKLSRALGLLNLAVDICKSVKGLEVGISASTDTILSCACTLSNYEWKSLEVIAMMKSMPGFLSGMLVGSLPALKELNCLDPSAADMDLLSSSGHVEKLTDLMLGWSVNAYESNISPAMIGAVRNVLQRATNVDKLYLNSSTFEFLDCENLVSVKHLELASPENPPERPEIDFAPALARPWPNLESLYIIFAVLKGPDLVRIFEAEDAFPAIEEFLIERSYFSVDELSSVHRPNLEYINLDRSGGDALLSKLTQLAKAGTCSLPNLRGLEINFLEEATVAAKDSFFEFLSCPFMAQLDSLNIANLQIGVRDTGILCEIAHRCPKLEILDLRRNKLGRAAVYLLQGFGNIGAWPQLKELGILQQNNNDGDIDAFNSEHPYLPPLDIQATLRGVWPDLKCV